jgi:hypothetical protein
MSSPYLRMRFGIKTPAIFYSDFYKRIVAFFTAYETFPLSRFISTETIQLHTWLQQLRNKPLYIDLPYFSCFTTNFSSPP